MFAYIDKTDKYGITHRNYFLTQGDSFRLTANDDNRGIIKSVTFKLGTVGENENDINEFFRKNYELADDGVWYLFIESDETMVWDITAEGSPYIYEIEVEFLDGGVETVRQANFTIWKQMKSGENNV